MITICYWLIITILEWVLKQYSLLQPIVSLSFVDHWLVHGNLMMQGWIRHSKKIWKSRSHFKLKPNNQSHFQTWHFMFLQHFLSWICHEPLSIHIDIWVEPFDQEKVYQMIKNEQPKMIFLNNSIVRTYVSLTYDKLESFNHLTGEKKRNN